MNRTETVLCLADNYDETRKLREDYFCNKSTGTSSVNSQSTTDKKAINIVDENDTFINSKKRHEKIIF